MIRFIYTLALLVMLATTGYSQQAVRDDGFVEKMQLPWVTTSDKADTISVSLFDEDGEPVPDVWIESWIEMKTSPFGERYNILEWELMKAGYLYLPEYYEFEDGTNNAGYSIG